MNDWELQRRIVQGKETGRLAACTALTGGQPKAGSHERVAAPTNSFDLLFSSLGLHCIFSCLTGNDILGMSTPGSQDQTTVSSPRQCHHVSLLTHGDTSTSRLPLLMLHPSLKCFSEHCPSVPRRGVGGRPEWGLRRQHEWGGFLGTVPEAGADPDGMCGAGRLPTEPSCVGTTFDHVRHLAHLNAFPLRQGGVVAPGLETPTWLQSLALPLSDCAALGRSRHSSVPQFPHL